MIRTHRAFLHHTVMAVLAGTLLLAPAAYAQGSAPWESPSPQRVERFLEVFTPDLVPGSALSDYQVVVMRLSAVADAWAAGDRLTAADLILAPADATDLAPLADARGALQSCRQLSIFWNDPDARVAFLRYYNEVYLPRPEMAEEQDDFAAIFLASASITDESDPGRFMYTHLSRYGYTATAGLTPANYLFDLYRRFDRAVADAGRLGMPASKDILDVAAYRNAVMSRLVTQIDQARRFADARVGSIESWGEIVNGEGPTTPVVIEPIAPDPVPAPPAESSDTDIFISPPDATVPPPFYPPADEGTLEDTTAAEPPVTVIEPAPAPEPPPDPLAGVDIFRLPDDQRPPAATPAPVVPVSSDADPEVFAAPASGSDPTTIEPLPTPGVESEVSGIDLFQFPSEEPAAEPSVDPVPDPAAVEANRAAGEAMRIKALDHARTVGGYALDLVLLWNSSRFATPEGKAEDTALTAKFRQEKERLLASLYLVDIYGIAARLELTPEALDQQLLEALHEQYNTRKDLNDAEVIRLMTEIDKVHAQLAEGIETRRESTSVALAQQKAYDALKGSEFASISQQLEATVLETPAS